MSRSFVPSTCAVCMSLLFALFDVFAVRTQASEVRPNIVFIVADDLGYADLSGYGRNDYQTPRLDRLAAAGVRFSQAYAAAPVCSPTRVAFMTGRYPARSHAGLWEPLTGSPNDRMIGLPPEQPTVSSLLKAHGYATALIGKWHMGLQSEHHPNRHGFDFFFGILEGATDYITHVDTQGSPALMRNGERIERDGYLTDLLTDEAAAFITRPHARPFFLSLQYTAPHWPWQAPGDPPYTHRGAPPASEPSATPAGDASPSPGAPANWRSGGSAQTYAAMVARLDHGVGLILDALERTGLSKSTLVIFTSDNGGEQFSDMAPFSGRKMQLWEGGIRVPAMMRWPGVIDAGRETDQVAITMDWTATILSAAGIPPNTQHALDGMNLLPICRGEAPVQPRTLSWRTFQRTKHKALRHGDWKYLHDGEREYLFDLAHDPGEKSDLKSEQPQLFEELRNLHRSWEAEVLTPVSLSITPYAALRPRTTLPPWLAPRAFSARR